MSTDSLDQLKLEILQRLNLKYQTPQKQPGKSVTRSMDQLHTPKPQRPLFPEVSSASSQPHTTMAGSRPSRLPRPIQRIPEDRWSTPRVATFGSPAVFPKQQHNPKFNTMVQSSVPAHQASKDVWYDVTYPSPMEGATAAADAGEETMYRQGRLRSFFDDIKRNRTSIVQQGIDQKYRGLVEQQSRHPLKKDVDALDQQIELERQRLGHEKAKEHAKSKREPVVRERGISSRREEEQEMEAPVVGRTKLKGPAREREDVLPSVQKEKEKEKRLIKPEYKAEAKSETKTVTKQEPHQEEAAKRRSKTPPGLERCRFCERTFSPERLEKHETVCLVKKQKSEAGEEIEEKKIEKKVEKKAVEKKPPPVPKVSPTKQMDHEKKEEHTETPTPAAIVRPERSDGTIACAFCQRRFSPDRIEKHEACCTKGPNKKPRKVMDGTSLRLKGVDWSATD